MVAVAPTEERVFDSLRWTVLSKVGLLVGGFTGAMLTAEVGAKLGEYVVFEVVIIVGVIEIVGIWVETAAEYALKIRKNKTNIYIWKIIDSRLAGWPKKSAPWWSGRNDWTLNTHAPKNVVGVRGVRIRILGAVFSGK